MFKTELTNETQAIARHRVLIKRQLRETGLTDLFNNDDPTERLEALLKLAQDK
jgi:hypothetical protein